MAKVTVSLFQPVNHIGEPYTKGDEFKEGSYADKHIASLDAYKSTMTVKMGRKEYRTEHWDSAFLNRNRSLSDVKWQSAVIAQMRVNIMNKIEQDIFG